MVLHTFNSSMQAEADISEIKVSLVYIMGPCLKKKKLKSTSVAGVEICSGEAEIWGKQDTTPTLKSAKVLLPKGQTLKYREQGGKNRGQKARAAAGNRAKH